MYLFALLCVCISVYVCVRVLFAHMEKLDFSEERFIPQETLFPTTLLTDKLLTTVFSHCKDPSVTHLSDHLGYNILSTHDTWSGCVLTL